MKKESVELEITEHVKNGWKTFSLQQIEKMKKIEEKLKKYEATLKDIANYMENWEDFYSGVGINYHEMINSIIKLANYTLKEGNE